MSDRKREDWGQAHREAVGKARSGTWYLLAGSVPGLVFLDGVAQWCFVVAFLVALAALYPGSPVISTVVQRIPGLPKRGDT